MSDKKAVIIGAGPAGLTAAYELLDRTDIQPDRAREERRTWAASSRTVNYKGNRIDIGGHRFFSKSDRVMDWWLACMPLEARPPAGSTDRLPGQEHASVAGGAAPARSANDRSRHAGAQPHVAHLLPAAVLRLPDHARTSTR